MGWIIRHNVNENPPEFLCPNYSSGSQFFTIRVTISHHTNVPFWRSCRIWHQGSKRNSSGLTSFEQPQKVSQNMQKQNKTQGVRKKLQGFVVVFPAGKTSR
ncbi:subtilase family protein [Striga asiatica]|uniref:Subtilase family protein n=1 Tax=Striga asiatica TaxID=4170 RepID=A0A5A7RIU4_STRAF|nr:subtilase family protein [Striga asiatica]